MIVDLRARRFGREILAANRELQQFIAKGGKVADLSPEVIKALEAIRAAKSEMDAP